jgi:hypothetical protein
MNANGVEKSPDLEKEDSHTCELERAGFNRGFLDYAFFNLAALVEESSARNDAKRNNARLT